MKPPPFDYIACQSEAEAIECLAQYGEDARVLAGGQSLVPMLNMRLIEPQVLADISRVVDLARIETLGVSALRVAAAVTQTALMRQADLREKVPLLAATLPHVGHHQTRNRGTVCGSIAHADPSSELPLSAAVLDAVVELKSRAGLRRIAARDFFAGLLQTARRPDELVTAVEFPVAAQGEAFAFREVAMRHGDFAILSVAVKVRQGSITIGIGGGAEKPEVREWQALEASALDDALNQLAWELPLQDDIQAPAAYRRRLVRMLGRRTIEGARQCLP